VNLREELSPRSFISRILRPVERHGAVRHLRFVLTSFAGTVIVTRLYLGLTGFPQLGRGQLHIAHVLWGGLLLFLAALLPIVFSNRWVYSTTGIISGIGVGLFIDEVGKFITRSNDYFYPPAAPIIYAFFLLTVLIYLQVKRPRPRDPRAELYAALDELSEVLDHDLDAAERADLRDHLIAARDGSPSRDLADLANALLRFLDSEQLTLAVPTPGPLTRLQHRYLRWQQNTLTRSRLRLALSAGLGLLGAWALANLLLWLLLGFAPGVVSGTPAALVVSGSVVTEGGFDWYLVRLGLQAAVGVLLLVAFALLLTGRDRRGLRYAYYGLLISLTMVNLLVFYFDQFKAVSDTLVQFVALLGVISYRRRFLGDIAESDTGRHLAVG
jgi:hypothetical protein